MSVPRQIALALAAPARDSSMIARIAKYLGVAGRTNAHGAAVRVLVDSIMDTLESLVRSIFRMESIKNIKKKA